MTNPQWVCFNCRTTCTPLPGDPPGPCTCERPVWTPGEGGSREPSEGLPRPDVYGDAEDRVLALFAENGGGAVVRYLGRAGARIPVIGWVPPDTPERHSGAEQRRRAAEGMTRIISLSRGTLK